MGILLRPSVIIIIMLALVTLLVALAAADLTSVVSLQSTGSGTFTAVCKQGGVLTFETATVADIEDGAVCSGSSASTTFSPPTTQPSSGPSDPVLKEGRYSQSANATTTFYDQTIAIVGQLYNMTFDGGSFAVDQFTCSGASCTSLDGDGYKFTVYSSTSYFFDDGSSSAVFQWTSSSSEPRPAKKLVQQVKGRRGRDGARI